MSSDASDNSCCRLPSAASHADDTAPPSDACVLAAMGCGPMAVSAPSAPIVFQFLVPDGPAYRVAELSPLARIAVEDASIDAERELRPRPPRVALAPGYRG